MIGLLNGSHFDGLKPEIITDSIVSSAIQNVSEYSYTPPTYTDWNKIYTHSTIVLFAATSVRFSHIKKQKTKNTYLENGKKFEDQQEIGVRI